MQMMRVGTVATCVAAMMVTAGCRIDTHKSADGEDKNVRIATPFGGLSVKSDESVTASGMGLDVYPGAVQEKKEKGHDGAADVNLSFGSFHLGVKAVSFLSDDAPDKVLAFYRGKMGKFGTVILCRHNEAVGTPTRTQDGLTCDDENKHGVHINTSHDDHDKQELKAGSRQHQHIVEVETRGTGTKFGLVMLDLPMKIDGDDGEDKQ
jgi:hypothetical protein